MQGHGPGTADLASPGRIRQPASPEAWPMPGRTLEGSDACVPPSLPCSSAAPNLLVNASRQTPGGCLWELVQSRSEVRARCT